MDKLIILTACLLGVVIASHDYYYFPVVQSKSFKKLPVGQLRCPPHSSEKPLSHKKIWGGYVLTQNIQTMPGTFVVKQRWGTTCTMNFWGVKTIRHHIIDEQILDARFTNITLKPVFPDEDCSWMTTATREITYYVGTKGELEYDISTGKTSDPVFGAFSCTEKLCYVDHRVVFIPDVAIAATSKGFKFVVFEISTDPDGVIRENSVIQSRDFPRMSLRKACVTEESVLGQRRLAFILRNGFFLVLEMGVKSGSHMLKKSTETLGSELILRASLRLSNDKFKGRDLSMLYTQEKISGAGSIDNLLNGFRVCDASDRSRIKQVGLGFNSLEQDERIMSRVDSLFCRVTLDRIRKCKKLTSVELGMFAQNYGGPGPVYRIKNDTLEVAQGIYKRIFWDPDTKNRLGYYVNETTEKEVNCPEWIKISEGFESCINGIIRYKNVTSHPLSPVNDLEQEEALFKEHFLEDVYHVPTQHLNPWAGWNPLHPPEIDRHFLGLKLPNIFGFMHNFEIYLVTFIVGLISLPLIIFCCRRKSSRY
ncbi:glycoprotein [Kwatta virus]|uniref:Glycoprotein n=1 Tax=Kwatta virus TaxID=1272945 RepID=A0A0D3R1F7_9RHAB|nr:glycoprotein [Kwatta virus]AJR28290.1 glycoprotein [Kwatta virus]